MAKDVACGVITLAIAVLYLFAAAALPTSALGDDVGASGFPMLIGWTLAGVSLLLIGQGLWAWLQRRAAAAETSGVWAHPGRAVRRAAGVVAIAAAFLLALETLGYVLSLALMIAAISIYQGMPPSWRVAQVAAGGAVGFWLLFVWALGIPLPAGIWAGLF